jgi:NAD(P)-dependent dehydrogenase (short-subunit alcohol dehydrogenase family)
LAGALAGKVALVTGASRGIGRAFAIEISGHGAAVAVNYVSSYDAAEKVVQEIEAAGGRAVAVQADIAQADECRRLIEATEDALGPIDILVNNAGIARPRMVHRMTTEEWDEVLSANLDSAFYLSAPVMRGMRERRYGRVINIASVMGQRAAIGSSNYSAAKAGLIAFTRATALEMAPYNVTVNAVCPGWILTDMNTRLEPEQKEELLKSIPLGRFGEPEDIARMVRFLLIEGDWITGQQLNVNGGEHM